MIGGNQQFNWNGAGQGASNGQQFGNFQPGAWNPNPQGGNPQQMWMAQQQMNSGSQNFQLPASTSSLAQGQSPLILPCRVINDPNDIRPGEVPMDGGVSFFVQSDGTRIYGKQWNKEGNIDTAVYELVRPQNQEVIIEEESKPSQEFLQLNERLDDIVTLLNSLKISSTKSTQKKAPKGDSENAE